jgi:hypothetical protein
MLPALQCHCLKCTAVTESSPAHHNVCSGTLLSPTPLPVPAANGVWLLSLLVLVLLVLLMLML